MLRRNVRLRKEYLYRKSLEGKERAVYERKQGKPIPTELRGEEKKLRNEVELEDDNTAVSYGYWPQCLVLYLYCKVAVCPAQPSPAQPSPAQPSPAQPSPAQPSPAQPSPAQPSPAQPSPAQPSPAQPSPAQPSPAQPSPAQPSPAQPSPAQPSPAQPSPAQPSPAQPSPAQPSPAQPSPAQPNPTQPSRDVSWRGLSAASMWCGVVRAQVQRTHVDDEYAHAGEVDPKVLVTTSRDPSSRLVQFAKEMKLVLPNSQRINRGGMVLAELVDSCRSHDFTDIVILHEHRGEPDGLVVCHLPYGPTAYFGLHNTVLRHDIGKKSEVGTISEAFPHLVLDQFSSKLGARCANILKHLFPVPKDDTKSSLGAGLLPIDLMAVTYLIRVITFANRADYISFRHHTYSQPKGSKSIELTECGPRFEMKLYQIKLGTVDQDHVENEWVLRSYTRVAKKQRLADETEPATAGSTATKLQPAALHRERLSSARAMATSGMPLLQYEDGPALLARMGGLTILKSVVETMYAVITTDPLLNPFFMNVAIERVREKLLLFLTYAFGGASEYYGRDISFIHRPLITQHGLGLQHFDRFVSHFLAACRQHHVDKAAVNEANMLLNATRPIFDPRKYKGQIKTPTPRGASSMTAAAPHPHPLLFPPNAPPKEAAAAAVQPQSAPASPAGSATGAPAVAPRPQVKLSQLGAALGPVLLKAQQAAAAAAAASAATPAGSTAANTAGPPAAARVKKVLTRHDKLLLLMQLLGTPSAVAQAPSAPAGPPPAELQPAPAQQPLPLEANPAQDVQAPQGSTAGSGMGAAAAPPAAAPQPACQVEGTSTTSAMQVAAALGSVATKQVACGALVGAAGQAAEGGVTGSGEGAAAAAVAAVVPVAALTPVQQQDLAPGSSQDETRHQGHCSCDGPAKTTLQARAEGAQASDPAAPQPATVSLAGLRYTGGGDLHGSAPPPPAAPQPAVASLAGSSASTAHQVAAAPQPLRAHHAVAVATASLVAGAESAPVLSQPDSQGGSAAAAAQVPAAGQDLGRASPSLGAASGSTLIARGRLIPLPCDPPQATSAHMATAAASASPTPVPSSPAAPSLRARTLIALGDSQGPEGLPCLAAASAPPAATSATPAAGDAPGSQAHSGGSPGPGDPGAAGAPAPGSVPNSAGQSCTPLQVSSCQLPNRSILNLDLGAHTLSLAGPHSHDGISRSTGLASHSTPTAPTTTLGPARRIAPRSFSSSGLGTAPGSSSGRRAPPSRSSSLVQALYQRSAVASQRAAMEAVVASLHSAAVERAASSKGGQRRPRRPDSQALRASDSFGRSSAAGAGGEGSESRLVQAGPNATALADARNSAAQVLKQQLSAQENPGAAAPPNPPLQEPQARVVRPTSDNTMPSDSHSSSSSSSSDGRYLSDSSDDIPATRTRKSVTVPKPRPAPVAPGQASGPAQRDCVRFQLAADGGTAAQHSVGPAGEGQGVAGQGHSDSAADAKEDTSQLAMAATSLGHTGWMVQADVCVPMSLFHSRLSTVVEGPELDSARSSMVGQQPADAGCSDSHGDRSSGHRSLPQLSWPRSTPLTSCPTSPMQKGQLEPHDLSVQPHHLQQLQVLTQQSTQQHMPAPQTGQQQQPLGGQAACAPLLPSKGTAQRSLLYLDEYVPKGLGAGPGQHPLTPQLPGRSEEGRRATSLPIIPLLEDGCVSVNAAHPNTKQAAALAVPSHGEGGKGGGSPTSTPSHTAAAGVKGAGDTGAIAAPDHVRAQAVNLLLAGAEVQAHSKLAGPGRSISPLGPASAQGRAAGTAAAAAAAAAAHEQVLERQAGGEAEVVALPAKAVVAKRAQEQEEEEVLLSEEINLLVPCKAPTVPKLPSSHPSLSSPQTHCSLPPSPSSAQPSALPAPPAAVHTTPSLYTHSHSSLAPLAPPPLGLNPQHGQAQAALAAALSLSPHSPSVSTPGLASTALALLSLVRSTASGVDVAVGDSSGRLGEKGGVTSPRISHYDLMQADPVQGQQLGGSSQQADAAQEPSLQPAPCLHTLPAPPSPQAQLPRPPSQSWAATPPGTDSQPSQLQHGHCSTTSLSHSHQTSHKDQQQHQQQQQQGRVQGRAEPPSALHHNINRCSSHALTSGITLMPSETTLWSQEVSSPPTLTQALTSRPSTPGDLLCSTGPQDLDAQRRSVPSPTTQQASRLLALALASSHSQLRSSLSFQRGSTSPLAQHVDPRPSDPHSPAHPTPADNCLNFPALGQASCAPLPPPTTTTTTTTSPPPPHPLPAQQPADAGGAIVQNSDCADRLEPVPPQGAAASAAAAAEPSEPVQAQQSAVPSSAQAGQVNDVAVAAHGAQTAAKGPDRVPGAKVQGRGAGGAGEGGVWRLLKKLLGCGGVATAGLAAQPHTQPPSPCPPATSTPSPPPPGASPHRSDPPHSLPTTPAPTSPTAAGQTHHSSPPPSLPVLPAPASPTAAKEHRGSDCIPCQPQDSHLLPPAGPGALQSGSEAGGVGAATSDPDQQQPQRQQQQRQQQPHQQQEGDEKQHQDNPQQPLVSSASAAGQQSSSTPTPTLRPPPACSPLLPAGFEPVTSHQGLTTSLFLTTSGSLGSSLQPPLDAGSVSDMAELRSKCSVKASLGSLGTQSLFDKLGSYAAIEACVTLFYARLTTDPDLAHFFDGVDIKKLAMKQTMFMAYAFGGVPAWEGRSLSAAHAQLVRNQGLNLMHFDKVTQHFVEVLQQLAVQQQYIDEAVLVLLGVRHLFDPDAILDNEEQELEVQRQRRASRLAAGWQAGPH
ncbi:hypothetical protein QJQ45_023100 [Haematococcus lacustris]|nr:hypothetical protein QJQ45_023100 [Haematococcus lacustris]